MARTDRTGKDDPLPAGAEPAVPNGQEVNDAADRLCDALHGFSDNVAIAALADVLGMICNCDGNPTKAMLEYACERAWREANLVFVKRSDGDSREEEVSDGGA